MCGTEPRIVSAWQERFIISSPSDCNTWVTANAFTNCSWDIIEDFEAAARRLAILRRRCREAIEFLKEWHARELRPWLLIAKRFDFRTAPRWSASRWKSKT